jgi:class 3 adenylate cyclase/tetratricopeptide (TPR) repeat protein
LQADAVTWLQQYAWPGNVRELGHLLERVTLLHSDEIVTAATLAHWSAVLPMPEPTTATAPAPATAFPDTFPATAAPTPAQEISTVLRQTGGNLSQAARLLGLSRDQLRARMRRYGVTRPVWPERLPVPPAPPRRADAPKIAAPVQIPEEPIAPAAAQTMAAPPPLPPGERRQLTVLFADLVGSTALASALDPELWQALLHVYHTICTDVMARFDGHIAQYLGDGVLVYFGYPQAQEDDARRAVQAALALVEAVRRPLALPDSQEQRQLQVRLGLHTGLVVIGGPGSGETLATLALGVTPHIAARLQEAAAPDTVVISDSTARLVAGYFIVQALEAQALKGVPTPVPIYHVLGVSGARTRLEAARGHDLTPLVGRDAEVALLRARWAQVQEGLGQVVLLSGEAGIGKSRLGQVLQEQIVGAAATVIVWQASPAQQHSPLAPIISALQQRLGLRRETPPATALATLEGFVEAQSLSRSEAVPLFAALLALPLEAPYVPLALAPEQLKHQTLAALVHWLAQEAARQPVLLLVEDLHWLDASTLDVLTALVDQGPTVPLYTLLTARPEFVSPWTGRGHVTHLTLTRLPRQQVEALVAGVTGGKRLPAVVLQTVVSTTDGVPLFVEELTKMVLESGLLQDDGSAYTLTGPMPPLAIPATLQGSLLARLDRLGAAREVAQLGAALGREFPYALLRAVASQEEAVLHTALAQLVAAELLYQRGLPPHSTYQFKHALVQEAAYQSLLQRTRQQYHQQIAEILTTHFPDLTATQPEVLARHYTAAGLTTQALPVWRQAGEQALARSASREAARCLGQAIEAVQQLPDSRERREQAVDLRLALRAALRPLADGARLLTHLHEAEALAESLDDPRRLGHVLSYLAVHYYSTSDHAQAIATAQRALALATASGNVFVAALASQCMGFPLQAQGHYLQAIACYHHTAALLTGTWRYARQQEVAVPASFARALSAYCHAELGRFVEGQALGEDGLQIAETVAHPVSLMFAAWGAGLLALRQGDLVGAMPRLEQAVRLGWQDDLIIYFPRMAGGLGEAYLLDGRLTDALALLTQARARAGARRENSAMRLCILPLAQTHLRLGHLEEAQALAAGALAGALEDHERGQQAYALRLLGAIAAQRTPLDATPAETHYRQALTLTEELGMRPLQAHCHCDLGTLYARLERWEPARAALTQAITLYRAMAMTFWLPQAEALLATLGG